MSEEIKNETSDELEQYNVSDQVVEDKISFKRITDRTVYHILNPHNEQPMVEISGYDLHIDFNQTYLKSTKDVEAACEGLSQLFRELILEQLLENAQQPKE